MRRGWVLGALAVVLAHFALFWLIVFESYSDWFMPAIVVMLLVVMNVAGLGAFIIAWRAPKFRLPLALTMAPLTAALGTLSNLLFGYFGVRADLSGFYDDAGLFMMLLGYGMFVSVVGAGIGIWVGRRRVDESPSVTPLPAVAETLPEMSPAPVTVIDDLPQIRSD